MVHDLHRLAGRRASAGLLLVLLAWHSCAGQQPRTSAEQQEESFSPRIELVAACASPLDQRGWWDAEGRPMEEPPQMRAAKPASEEPEDLEPDEISRLIVLKARVAPSATLQCKVDGQKWTIRLPEQADDRPWDELKAEAKERDAPFEADEFEWIEYSLGVYIIRPLADRFATVRVNVADGPWKTVAVRPRQPTDGVDLEFDLGKLEDGKVEAFSPETEQQSVRVMAEDADGELHPAMFNLSVTVDDGTAGAGSALKVRTRFRLPVGDIKAYHLQTRPYQQFELQGVPLYSDDISAVKQIRLAGGSFRGDRDLLFDRQPSDKPVDLDWLEPADDQLALIRHVPSLRRIYVASDRITDHAAEILSGIGHLQHVRMTGPQLTHRALEPFGGALLLALELQGDRLAAVPRSSLEKLARAKQLRRLNLWDTELTDDAAAGLAAARGLEVLAARGEKLTDAGLQQLGQLSELRELRLGMTNCADAGLEHLAQLKHLRVLDVRSPRITDAAMRHLAELKELRSLNLAGTAISDEGLRQLHALRHLEYLDLRGTQCTRSGREALDQATDQWTRTYLPEPAGKDITLRVTVLEPDGSPVPGAALHLFTAEEIYLRTNRIGNPGPQLPELDQTVTGKDGKGALRFNTSESDGWLVLWAVGPDGRPAVVNLQTPQNKPEISREVQLSSESLKVRMIDHAGQPAADVDVFPLQLHGGLRSRGEVPPSLLPQLAQTTDDAGNVVLPGVTPRHIANLAFDSEAHGSQSTGWMREGELNHNPTIQLAPTGSLAGRLVGSHQLDANQLRGLMYTDARFEEHPDADLVAEHSWARLEVAEDGSFSVPHLAVGYARFVGDAEGEEDRIRWETQKIDPDETAYAEFDVIKPVKITGLIRLLESWEPAADLEFQVSSGGRHGRFDERTTATTDASGRFMAWAPPGELNLYVSRFYENEFESIEHWLWRDDRFGGYRTITAEDAHQDLEPIDLVERDSETGKLIDAQGNPIADASVYGFPAPLDAEVTNSSNAYTDKDGTFEISYPRTHPPIAFRGSDRDGSYTVKQQKPLILVDESK